MIRAGDVRLFLFLAGLALALPAGAGAQPIEEARAAHAEGRFAEAARIGASVGTSGGYAMAARALAYHAHFLAPHDRKEGLLDEAVALAEKAVRADPGNPEAHLQLAHTVGRLSQAVGSFEAANRGYAEKIREAAENALKLDPGMAAAHLAMGAWHAEVVAAVGSFLARITYGARERDAIAHFDKAVAGAPQVKAVYLEYALGLLALDEDEYRDRARGLLARAIEIPAKDAYDRILHRRAAERLKALDVSGG